MTRKSRNMQVEILSTGYQPKINVIITSICDINNFKSYCHYKITSDLRQANNVTKWCDCDVGCNILICHMW